MCSRNTLYYYQDDVRELLDAFPNRKFKHLDIRNTLGDERATYYVKRIRKFKEDGIVRSIGKNKINGKVKTNVWEIPIPVADYVMAKTTKREHIKAP
jgi:hypothetical protein